MAFFNRKLYRQKPKQWGPVSQVQSSIFENADRAGIDPGSIALVMPFWEKAGMAKDYILLSRLMSEIQTNWTNDGIDFAIGSKAFYSLTIAQISLSWPKTLISVFDPTSVIGTTTAEPIFGLTDFSAYYVQTCLFCQSDVLRCRLNSVTSFSIGGLSPNTNSVGIVTSQSNILHEGYLNGIKGFISTVDTSFPAGIDVLQFGADYRSSSGYNNSEVKLKSAIILNDYITANQAAYFSDNPYFLLNRVPPVFYSLPSTGGSTLLPIDSITMSDNFSYSLSRSISDSISLSDTIIKSIGVAKSDTINLSDEIIKSIGLNKSDTISLSDGFNAIITLILSINDTINMSDEIIKEVSTSRADSISMSDNFSKVSSFIRSLSDTINLSDDLLKSISMALSDSVTMSDEFNSIASFILSLNDSISMSDSISKEVGLNESDTINITDNASTVTEFFRTFSDNISMSDEISKTFGLTEADIISMADEFSTSTSAIYALLNFVAKNKTFNFVAKPKILNFNALSKTLNFNAKPRG